MILLPRKVPCPYPVTVDIADIKKAEMGTQIGEKHFPNQQPLPLHYCILLYLYNPKTQSCLIGLHILNNV